MIKTKLNNLAYLTVVKKCTVQDIKAESLLVAVYDLLDNFIKSEESGNSKPILKESDIEKMEYIKTLSKYILEYLETVIMSANKIDYILLNSNKNSESNSKAKLVEPIAYFYEKLQKLVSSHISTICTDEITGKVFYMPELLAFRLIKQFQEYEGYNFKRFELIHSLDLSTIFKIYKDFSLEIKNTTGSKLFEKDLKKRNLISKMNYISLKVMDSYINCKYIDGSKNKSSKSKKRKKRKK